MRMKAWSAGLLMLLAGGAYAADVSEIAFSRSDDSLPAYSSSGETHLQDRYARLTVPLPDGTSRDAELLVLFEPHTGYYLWDHVVASPGKMDPREHVFQDWLKTSVLYADNDGIKWFALGGMDLLVRRSSGRAESLDRAYDEAFHDLQAHWPERRQRRGQFLKTVEVWKLLDSTFYRDPANTLFYPVIDDVARLGKDFVDGFSSASKIRSDHFRFASQPDIARLAGRLCRRPPWP